MDPVSEARYPAQDPVRRNTERSRPQTIRMPRPDNEPYEPTSERVCEDRYLAREDEYLIYLFHLATYDFAVPYVEGRRVLDFGCGTGYGAHRIASRCEAITGVDVSGEAVAFARDRYRAANLEFLEIPPIERAPLPFDDASFGAVLSFQVLEHVPDPDRYVAEARRVLSRDGVLIVATPDRTHRLLRGQRPWNRYHLVEYAPGDLSELLGRHFPVVESYGMGGEGDVLRPELARGRRLRWATLPFTFPRAPEAWRQLGLATLKRIEARRRERKPDPATTGGSSQKEQSASGGLARYGYDERAIRIAANARPSVNIVAVARA
jgi:SAM-dependent methyltransferase